MIPLLYIGIMVDLSGLVISTPLIEHSIILSEVSRGEFEFAFFELLAVMSPI